MVRVALNGFWVVVFVFVSCAGTRSVREEVVESYPDAYVGQGYSARGIEEGIAREQAKTNALVDISTQIEAEVKSLTEAYIRGTTASVGDASMGLSDQDYSRVARVVTSNFLRGVTPQKFIYQQDATIKAIIVMPKANFYEQMKTTIPDQVKRESLRIQLQHEEAQKKLDQEIEKRENLLSGQ